MRILSSSLAQKIAAVITLFSLCIAALLFIVLDYTQKKNMQDIAVRFIEASAQSMQNNLHKNTISYKTILSHLSQDYHDEANRFWLEVVENSLTNLPPNFHAFILNEQASIVSPKAPKHSVKPELLQKAIRPPFYAKARTIDTAQGRITYIVKVFEKEKLYLCMYYLHDSFQDLLWARKNVLIYIICIIIVLGMVSALFLSRYLARPLQKLTQATQHLSHIDLNHESLMQNLPDLPTQRHDDIGSLARSFQNMVKALQDNITQTLTLSAAHQKVESELLLAQNIQQSMLPQDFSAPIQEKNSCDIHGMVLPARAVGGDFFDIFWLNDTKFCFIIGDVSDKGVPAALFMSMTLSLLRLLMRTPMLKHNPAKCLEYANNTLCQNNTNTMFVSLIVGTLDSTTGHMEYANAGHMPPLCLQNTQELIVLPTHKEIVIATFEDINYTNITYDLQNGDRIFLYTDGVTEASNTLEERLGDTKLHNFLHQNRALPPQAFNERLVQHIQEFSKNCPQYDDITLLNFLWQKPA